MREGGLSNGQASPSVFWGSACVLSHAWVGVCLVMGECQLGWLPTQPRAVMPARSRAAVHETRLQPQPVRCYCLLLQPAVPESCLLLLPAVTACYYCLLLLPAATACCYNMLCLKPACCCMT